MSVEQNVRWKRRAIAVAAVAASFGGFAAVGSANVSAGNYEQWAETGDTVPNDSVPVDSVPNDTEPATTQPATTQPATTQPSTTKPSAQQAQPVPSSTVPTATAAAATTTDPAVTDPQNASAAPQLPATGPRSAMPTVFIAAGLLGAGSVALAFARRNSVSKGSQS